MEVATDRAPTYRRVLDEVLPAALHVVEQYANNPVETDHGRLKARLRSMRGLKQLRSARVISAGHAFIQNVRRGHYGVFRAATRRRPPTWPRALAAFSYACVRSRIRSRSLMWTRAVAQVRGAALSRCARYARASAISAGCTTMSR